MDQIVINDTDCGEAVAALAGVDYNPKTCVSFCRIRDGIRMGGVVFSNFTGESICAHLASWVPHWASRDLLFVGFDYPFNQLGVKRIFGQVPEDNWAARNLNENLGFRYVARIEEVFPGGVACLVMRMDRVDCRFLGIKPRHIKPNVN